MYLAIKCLSFSSFYFNFLLCHFLFLATTITLKFQNVLEMFVYCYLLFMGTCNIPKTVFPELLNIMKVSLNIYII